MTTTDRSGRALKTAIAELGRLRERTEQEARHRDVLERRLRALMAAAGAESTTVEVADAITPLGGGANLSEAAAPGDAGPWRREPVAPPARAPEGDWWPALRDDPQPLVPNAGWTNYGLQGRAAKVLGISVCGLGREHVARVVAMVAQQQTEARDFVPVFLTDSAEFDLFRAQGFVVEYVPAAPLRAGYDGAQAWEDYLKGRRVLLERKWGLTDLIVFGEETFGLPARGPTEVPAGPARISARPRPVAPARDRTTRRGRTAARA
jgi:hypothetical protein